MRISRDIALLFLVIILGMLLRFNKLGTSPVHLYWDETAIAYNAYSILETGKDEYGKTFPILFRSFDDYKAPGIIYLSTIPIALFGLSEFSARFTSAFLGTLTILAVYGLARELFTYVLTNRQEQKIVSIFAAFLFGLSPWSIQFSRAGFESNAGLFFVTLGMYLFIRSFRHSNLFPFAALTLALSVYFYRSIQIAVPLLVITTIILFLRKLKHTQFQILFASFAIFVFIMIPIMKALLSKEGLVRYQQTNIFSQLDKESLAQSKRILAHNNALWARVLYNRRLVPASAAIEGYATHLNLKFLFFDTNQQDRGAVDNFGLLYPIESVFIVVGFLYLVKKNRRVALFVLAWLAIGLLPAAVTTPTRNTLRSLNALPILSITSALGCLTLMNLLKSFRSILVFLVACSFVFFTHHYLTLYYTIWANNSASSWADGYKQLNMYIKKHEYEYEHIVISGHYWQPYIYTLFYTQYQPGEYQKSGSKYGFGKYSFGGTGWGGEKELDQQNLANIAQGKKTLFALSPPEYGPSQVVLNKLETIKNAQGSEVFYLTVLK